LTVRAKLREIAAAAAADPREAIYMALGHAMDGFEPLGNRVLVATYIQPEKTAGGIILSDRTLLESRFQGKAFLVIALGPLAFVDDNIAQFGPYARGEELEIKAGDWLIASPSDGAEFFGVDGQSGVSCRVFEDTRFWSRIDDPSKVY
jgi:co-chaperonin GroES (HSP10)